MFYKTHIIFLHKQLRYIPSCRSPAPYAAVPDTDESKSEEEGELDLGNRTGLQRQELSENKKKSKEKKSKEEK